MSALAKFGFFVFAAVITGLVVFCVGIAIANFTLGLLGLGIIALPALACILLLVANEIYEVRHDIPFQW